MKKIFLIFVTLLTMVLALPITVNAASNEKKTVKVGTVTQICKEKISSCKSSSNSIVSVDTKGRIFAKKAGKATVTFKLKSGSKKVYKVTVKKASSRYKKASECKKLLNKINSYRTANGKKALKVSYKMEPYCAKRAKEISKKFNTKNDGCWELMCYASYYDIDAIINCWQNDKNCNEALLKNDFSKAAVSIYKGKNNYFYYMVTFK